MDQRKKVGFYTLGCKLNFSETSTISRDFVEEGFERVEFRADNRNKRSIAAMQKIGCTVEGILRNHLPTSDGTRRDSIVLSMLKNEWPTIKAGFLARIKMLDQNK